MAGFFKVPHELYRVLSRDPNTFRVYCELAARARWTAGACLGSHGVVELSAGQCVLGRAVLARDLDLTERAVRTALERLSKLRAVTIEATKRGTVVTVHEDWTNDDAAPTERPSFDTKNDQAPAPPTAISSPTNEEVRRKKEEGYTHARDRHPKAGRIVEAVWNHGSKRCADLKLQNIPGVPPWPLMAGETHPARLAVLDRVCELLVETAPDETERVAINRIDVAFAKAIADHEGSWFAPLTMFTRNSFASWAYLDPKQFTRKPARVTEHRESGLEVALRIAAEEA